MPLSTDEIERDKPLIQQMAQYPLEAGQMLLLGPRSVAYLTGDYKKAPWLIKGEKAPGGKMLPDKLVLNREEWDGTRTARPNTGRNEADRR